MARKRTDEAKRQKQQAPTAEPRRSGAAVKAQHVARPTPAAQTGRVTEQARAVAADARGGPADPSLAYTAKPLALAQHRALRPSYRHELPSRPF